MFKTLSTIDYRSIILAGDSSALEVSVILGKIVIPWVCVTWYMVVLAVSLSGHLLIRRAYCKPHQTCELQVKDDTLPFVTILRPVKGCDANIDLCLQSTCLIDYPSSKFELIFSVASPSDQAIESIEHILLKNPNIDVRLMIGEEDVGPNPKIRNLSKAYREARGDIIWILDCNVWVPPGILKNGVRQLEGMDTGAGYKLVHHLPLCVDVTEDKSRRSGSGRSGRPTSFRSVGSWWSIGGGRLEENFMCSSHAKFYWAINNVGVAPCIIGKSNLFRRSHLQEATAQSEPSVERQGLLYFSDNICEDHLLAEKLWRTQLSEETIGAKEWLKHGLSKDLVYQPVQKMSIKDYFQRRSRWIRVRKYAVISATIAEPLTESIVCSLIGSYGVTSSLFFAKYIGESWWALCGVWWASMLLWAFADRSLFNFLKQYRSIIEDENTPYFITNIEGRSFGSWLAQWVGREALAFPIWAWAMWPGDVDWRGGRYKIRWKDMTVEEISRDGEKP